MSLLTHNSVTLLHTNIQVRSEDRSVEWHQNVHYTALINTTHSYPNLFANHHHGKYKKGSNV